MGSQPFQQNTLKSRLNLQLLSTTRIVLGQMLPAVDQNCPTLRPSGSASNFKIPDDMLECQSCSYPATIPQSSLFFMQKSSSIIKQKSSKIPQQTKNNMFLFPCSGTTIPWTSHEFSHDLPMELRAAPYAPCGTGRRPAASRRRGAAALAARR